MTVEAPSKMHPSMQFLVLIGISLGMMIAGTLIGMALVTVLYGLGTINQIMAFDTTAPNVTTSIWILQIASTTIPLFIAPVVFARYVVNEPKAYLKPAIKIAPAFFGLVLLVMLVSMPFMEFLIDMNQKMVLPHSLKWLQQWMRDKEDAATTEMQALLQMKTFGSMLFAVLEIGLLTAIAEEFLFRGCVQSIFTSWTKNHHWGIWIAAIIFSAFHMEFFGFLPRMVLGVFFGYFVYWSGSIWTGVLAHFINNGTDVVLTYLFQQKIISFDPDSSHYNYIIGTLSLIFTVFLFFVYQKVSVTKNKLVEQNGKGLGKNLHFE
ncbi:CPBP family intramembrane glutamic endopeptidase [uncultured Mucilaginibacter sp.]|uniref:CPBP family intramembrane glutamic endopeptidase n=1 Tax=uncultured Mucilaginibacter sp. TaxID=797541 RepID=UPI0025F5782F|nr:CPBP family intramembrane glutamic endopeptidase [uncultured Mucilaginibacter sp.]